MRVSQHVCFEWATRRSKKFIDDMASERPCVLWRLRCFAFCQELSLKILSVGGCLELCRLSAAEVSVEKFSVVPVDSGGGR